jgi:hypothetical protein
MRSRYLTKKEIEKDEKLQPSLSKTIFEDLILELI